MCEISRTWRERSVYCRMTGKELIFLPMRLLLVEDNAADAELTVRQLQSEGVDCAWTRVATETAFGVPGLGTYLVQAQNSRDWMVIQNLVLIYGVVAVIINIVVDLSYAWIDPRVRYA